MNKLSSGQLKSLTAFAPDIYSLATSAVREEDALRFWDLCGTEDDLNGCLEWKGGKLFAINDSQLPPQYVALLLAGHGVRRDDLSLVPMVHRLCETPWCVNSEHLDWFYEKRAEHERS